MGGIALGKAVDSSGLLVIMDGLVRQLIDGLSLYHVVLVLSLVVLVRPDHSPCRTNSSPFFLSRLFLHSSAILSLAFSLCRSRPKWDHSSQNLTLVFLYLSRGSFAPRGWGCQCQGSPIKPRKSFGGLSSTCYAFLRQSIHRANQVDEMGKPYLTNVDFLKNGVPASFIATIVSDDVILYFPLLTSHY